jgi:hypothetical protein
MSEMQDDVTGWHGGYTTVGLSRFAERLRGFVLLITAFSETV